MLVLAVVPPVVLSLLALVVLSAAGVIAPDLTAGLPWLIWIVVAMDAVSVVVNALSPSPGERRLWVPVGLAMLVTSLLVALLV
jgi:hypothetical protein